MQIEKIEKITLIDTNGVEINPGDIIMYSVKNGKETIFAEFHGFKSGLLWLKPFMGMEHYKVKPATVDKMFYVQNISFAQTEEAK